MKSSGVKRPTHRCAKGMALLMTTALIVGHGMSGSSILSEAAPGDALKDKYTGFEGVEIDWKYGSADDTTTYGYYAEKHANVANATETIEVDLSSVRGVNGN